MKYADNLRFVHNKRHYYYCVCVYCNRSRVESERDESLERDELKRYEIRVSESIKYNKNLFGKMMMIGAPDSTEWHAHE